jgi:hypothetical protein
MKEARKIETLDDIQDNSGDVQNLFIPAGTVLDVEVREDYVYIVKWNEGTLPICLHECKVVE